MPPAKFTYSLGQPEFPTKLFVKNFSQAKVEHPSTKRKIHTTNDDLASIHEEHVLRIFGDSEQGFLSELLGN